jgi:hypothetical protein
VRAHVGIRHAYRRADAGQDTTFFSDGRTAGMRLREAVLRETGAFAGVSVEWR